MELRHLRYFVAVAEELHFTRAAARVGIAQPPFSQQIQALEREVGAPLLVRTKSSVKLTPPGQALLPEARKALAQAEHAMLAARRAARGEVGRLAVGFVYTAVYGKFTAAFGLMRSRCPEVAFVLRDLTSEEQVVAMKKGEIDVGLVRAPVPSAGEFAVRTISRERLVVALPQRHPLASRRRVPLKALASEPFLLVPRHLGPGFYDQVMGFCARAGFVPKLEQEAHSIITIVSLIAGGMGVSLVPESLQSLGRSGVVFRPPIPPAPVTELAVMWRRDDPSPIVASFLKFIWEVAGQR